jgi:hypothetical protein
MIFICFYKTVPDRKPEVNKRKILKPGSSKKHVFRATHRSSSAAAGNHKRM